MNVARLLRRFDAAAHEQALAEVIRLAEENEHLRTELWRAEEAAEGWRDDALRLMEEQRTATGAQPGITQSGALVLVPTEQAA